MGDISVEGGAASLRLKYSKTRQSADGGFTVPLRVAGVLPCPVSVARALLDRACALRVPLGRGLQALGLPSRAFSFHSFRRGGCSFAFQQGATEADLARQGD